MEWIFRHISGTGPEDWLNENADFGRVFIAGDSAGANIAHHMGIRAGKERREFKISGMTLALGYREPEQRQGSGGSVDQRGRVGSFRIGLRAGSGDGGGERCTGEGRLGYAEELKKSGWEGKVEVMETKGEGHGFHLRNPNSDRARVVVQRFAEFLK
ncbi:hypothetical protein YC2023_103664 [Brassica napus]